MKMKNWLLFIVIMTWYCPILSSQSDVKTILYFKNGTTLVGELLDLEGDTMALFRLNKSVKRYPMSYIKKIVMKEVETNVIEEQFFLPNRFYYNLQLSSISNQVYRGFGVNQSVFYRISNKFLSGAGIGFENFVENVNLNTMPLFGSAKFYFKNKKKTPFVSARYGYGFVVSKIDPILEGTKGGAHFAAHVGLRLSGDYFMTEIFGGLKRQSITYVIKGNGVNSTSIFTANRLELGLSFMF